MTAVQESSIDSILAGQDHVVKAKTGTGKTIAFLAPAIDRLTQNGNVCPMTSERIYEC
jgi:superfamily II DNA/RNA helicase